MVTKKKILFLPVEIGLAHVTRSLAIAEEAQKRGHKVIFALSKQKQSLIKNKNIEIATINSFFSDQESVEKIKDPSYVSSFISEEIDILRHYKPDLVVNDLRLSAIVSCRITKTPFIFVTNSDGLPVKSHLPNLGRPKFFYKLISPILQNIVANFKEQYFEVLVQVLNSKGIKMTLDEALDMTYFVPEIKGYLPLINKKIKVHYVGPIFWNGFEQASSPSWLKTIKPDGKTIYLTFGGTGYDADKLILLSSLLVKSGYRVIVSSSNIAEKEAFPNLNNLFVSKYLPGFEVSKRVDLVVCHGGIGTTTQAILAGKPVVTIPFNPDQYLHGLRFQELGLGPCIININLLDLVKLNWHGFEEKGRSISTHKILKVVERVMTEKDKYKNGVEKFKKQLLGIDGSKEALDIIESL